MSIENPTTPPTADLKTLTGGYPADLRSIRHLLPVLFALGLVATGASAQSVSANGLSIPLPDGWRQETPSSGMRAAQAAVPGPGGEGQFTVFHFGEGGGGGVEANIERWIGQMDLVPGGTPERTVLDVGSLKAHLVDASGTLQASRIGSFPQTDMPDYRLFGAVVEGAGGPWYLRLIGPEDTLSAERDAFLAMIEGLTAP